MQLPGVIGTDEELRDEFELLEGFIELDAILEGTAELEERMIGVLERELELELMQ